MNLLRTTILSWFLVFGTGIISAQDLQEGSTTSSAEDYVKELKKSQFLAAQGHADAQYSLGVSYETGKGVAEDATEAVKWYQLAADQGHADAQKHLGFMHDAGKGVPQDDAKAVEWYRLAAEQGHVKAQNNIGNMYYYGAGVFQDNVRAYMWYDIATANGNKRSAKWRGETAEKMTSADVSRAQNMAQECMNSDYKNCGW
jgi:TPR repeat protein